jgi:F-type H+-transporting ATPase subunit b
MNFVSIAHAQEEELKTETGTTEHEGGVAASLGLNAGIFVSQLINFALIAAIIWLLILKPLTKKMAERQKMIDQSLDNAKKIEENLRISDEKYKEKIAAAKVESNAIMAKATKAAEDAAGQLKEKAKQEIEGLIEQAKRNIKQEREEMVVSIKKETAELVVAVAQKILGEKIDPTKDAALISDAVKKLK